jgi:hypothetical protein
MNSNSTSNAETVPDELMKELHGANEHFHRARETLETEMEGAEYRHQERVDAATENVRVAEREVEEVSGKISKQLHPDQVSAKDLAARRTSAPPAPDPQVADFEPLR